MYKILWLKSSVTIGLCSWLILAGFISVAQGLNMQKNMITAEYVSIGANGFEPKEIRRHKGPFLLLVRSKGTPVSHITLAHESNERLHDISIKRENPFGDLILDLAPGRYKLTDSDHPDCVLWITILK